MDVYYLFKKETADVFITDNCYYLITTTVMEDMVRLLPTRQPTIRFPLSDEVLVQILLTKCYR